MSVGDSIVVTTSTGQKLRGVVLFVNDLFICLDQGGGALVHVRFDAARNRWVTGGLSVQFE